MGDTSGFKRWTGKLAQIAKDAAYAEILDQAQTMVRRMILKVPVGKTGNLRRSIRIEEDKGKLRAFIKAGGQMTTVPVRKGQSASYDYALGTEWGNQQVPAQPFFYSTWRAGRKKAKQAINRKMKQAIEAAK